MPSFNNLTGKKYNKLLLQKFVGRTSLGAALWECKCDCGNIIIRRGAAVKSGHTTSCGCARKTTAKKLEGKQFGRLTVISRKCNNKWNKTRWLCRCNCGNETTVTGSDLIGGLIKSCGCYALEIRQKGMKAGESSFNRLYYSYKRHATRRNYTWNLNKDNFFKLTQNRCFYCNKEPSQIYNSKQLNGKYIYNGIDRVDNTKGYDISNCVSCCGRCNRAKDDMSKQEFYDWVISVYQEISIKNRSNIKYEQ